MAKCHKCFKMSDGTIKLCYECLEKRNEELETLLQQLIWVAEKADTDANEDTTIELSRQALKGK